MGKLQINIEKGLPMVQKMVKTVIISNIIGKNSGWIYYRQNHYIIKRKVHEFVQSDVDAINEAITVIGEQLKEKMITYSDNREEVIRQVKEVSTIVKSAYIYGERLGKNRMWWENRLKKVSKNGLCSSFSADDVLNINLAVMDIANKLLGIEFTL